MRDSQRSKVYSAERCLQVHQAHRGSWQPAMTMSEAQALVDKIVASKVVQKRYPAAAKIHASGGITVMAGRGGGMATWHREVEDRRVVGPAIRSIKLGRWGRQPLVVMHEVAHWLVGLHNGHNWQFADAMLFLVRRYVGAEAHATLMASYKQHRVRHRPVVKRGPVAPERREQLVAQLALAREARAAASAIAAASPTP